MTTLQDLLEHLGCARWGGRDLDADVFEALGHEVKRDFYWKYRETPGEGRWLSLPHVTTSLDSATALVGSKFPRRPGENGDCWWAKRRDGTMEILRFYETHLEVLVLSEAKCATDCLSLIAATLKALIAKEAAQ